jgi:spermidine synthase
VASQFFRLPDEDERLRVVIGDGAAFVSEDDSQWDLIAVDGFDSNARAGALSGQPSTKPAAPGCRTRAAVGQSVWPSCGASRPSSSGIRKAFGGRVLALPEVDSGNVVAFATAGAPVEPSLATLRSGRRR